MKIYIYADMEGCSGISNSEFIGGGRPRFAELGCQFMVDDINACVAGCFDAGATEVIVRDGHSSGLNFSAADIDPRAEIIQGNTSRALFPDIDGAAGLILLGHHAMAGATGALLDHSYASRQIQNLWLNGRKIGEIGLNAAIAAEHNVRVLLVTGDDKACQEAVSWIPGVLACQVKKSYGTQSTRLLSPEIAHQMIRERTVEAIKRRARVRKIKVDYPAILRWEYLERVPVPVDERYNMLDARSFERTGDSLETLLLR